jgi:hypothetical protein
VQILETGKSTTHIKNNLFIGNFWFSHLPLGRRRITCTYSSYLGCFWPAAPNYLPIGK